MSDKFELDLEVNPNLQQYFASDKQSDIVIRAQTPSNKAYKLQKGYLYLESDYFSEQFKNAPQIKEIQLNIEDSPVLELILKCFYGFKCEIDKKNIFEALNICEYLKIETLQNQIYQYLQDKVDELDIVRVWIISQKQKNRQLEEACIKRFKREEYAIFRNPNAYLNTSPQTPNQLGANLKSELGLMPSTPASNIVLMNTEQFKKAILSQGNNFQFLKRKNVFNAIKFYCEKKFDSNKDAQNVKICKLSYEMIDPNQCSSDEYKDIFCQQIFHDYNNNQKKSSGSINNLSADPFRQSYMLHQSQMLFNNPTFSQTPINSKGFYNHYQSMHRFSGSNMLSPSPYVTKSNYFGGSNVPTSPSAFIFNNGTFSQCGAESLLFVNSIQGGRFGSQQLDDRSEKLNNKFDALKESYQNFMKMSSSSQAGDQSIIESCEQQIETLDQKMQRLLDEKKLRVSGLDEEIKKVDDYLVEQKKKHNMISMLNSNVMEDMNNMLTSHNQQNQSSHLFQSQLSSQINQSQTIHYHAQNDDLKEVERQINRKNTLQRLMSSNSSDNQDKNMLQSDTIPERPNRDDHFVIQDNPFTNYIESDEEEDNQHHGDNNNNSSSDIRQQQYQIQEEDNDDGEFSDQGDDVDIDEMMQDIDEFDSTQISVQPYSKQTVLKTPHTNLEEITGSVQLIENLQQPIQQENIEISNNNFRLNQSNAQNQIYFYESESGSHDYRKYNHQSAIRKPQAIFAKK